MPESARVDAAWAADSLDPLSYSETVAAEQESLLRDAVRKLDAAAALVYAIYHCGKDNVLAMPDSVLAAYARCCHEFNPKGTRAEVVDGG